MDDFLGRFDLVEIGLRLLGVVAILIVGRAVANLAKKGLLSSLKRTDLTESLNTLIVTLTYYTIMVLSVLLALAVLGVPTTTLVTVAGLVVVVLAIALQSSLGNLAATINFLLFKPFEVGDVIQVGAVLGIVQEIQIFNTILASPDHKIHVLPNAMIANTGLANYSKVGTIRVDLVFGIGYEDDIDKAKQVIGDMLTKDGRVLETPVPQIFVQTLNDSSVDIAAWPFVKIADFLAFQTSITEAVKKGFDEAGITIPYPQRDIHLIAQDGE